MLDVFLLQASRSSSSLCGFCIGQIYSRRRRRQGGDQHCKATDVFFCFPNTQIIILKQHTH